MSVQPPSDPRPKAPPPPPDRRPITVHVSSQNVPEWVYNATSPPPTDDEPYTFGEKDGWDADPSTGMPWTGLLIAGLAFLLGVVIGKVAL